MSIKRYKSEQIVTLLRQIEVEIAKGKTTPPSLQGSPDHRTDLLPVWTQARSRHLRDPRGRSCMARIAGECGRCKSSHQLEVNSHCQSITRSYHDGEAGTSPCLSLPAISANASAHSGGVPGCFRLGQRSGTVVPGTFTLFTMFTSSPPPGIANPRHN